MSWRAHCIGAVWVSGGSIEQNEEIAQSSH
jgi:hypothetical protein